MRQRRVPGIVSTARLAELDKLSTNELVALRADLDVLRNLHGVTVSKLRVECEAITALIRQRGRPRFEVSDHAVVRYLEKFMGVDLGAVRQEIIDRASRAADASPASVCRSKGDAVAYVDGDCHFVVARHNTVVTCHRGDRPLDLDATDLPVAEGQ